MGIEELIASIVTTEHRASRDTAFENAEQELGAVPGTVVLTEAFIRGQYRYMLSWRNQNTGRRSESRWV